MRRRNLERVLIVILLFSLLVGPALAIFMDHASLVVELSAGSFDIVVAGQSARTAQRELGSEGVSGLDVANIAQPESVLDNNG